MEVGRGTLAALLNGVARESMPAAMNAEKLISFGADIRSLGQLYLSSVDDEMFTKRPLTLTLVNTPTTLQQGS
jgi:hypothetical protein